MRATTIVVIAFTILVALTTAAKLRKSHHLSSHKDEKASHDNKNDKWGFTYTTSTRYGPTVTTTYYPYSTSTSRTGTYYPTATGYPTPTGYPRPTSTSGAYTYPTATRYPYATGYPYPSSTGNYYPTRTGYYPTSTVNYYPSRY